MAQSLRLMRALVDARSTLQLFELLLDFRKAQTLRMAKAEKAADVGAVLQEFKRLIPQEIIEVDENVAAQDELHFTEGAVHGEIMVAEGHRVTDVSSNDGRVRARREISGKAALATCCGENLAASADHGQRVDATLRGAQSGAADVRCEDRCAIEQTRLFEQYGERIDLSPVAQPACQILKRGHVRSIGRTFSFRDLKTAVSRKKEVTLTES